MKQLKRLFLSILIVASAFSGVHCDTNLSSGAQWGTSTFVPSFLMWPTVGDISIAAINYGYNTVQSFVQNPKVAWSITGTAILGAGLFSWWKTQKCNEKNQNLEKSLLLHMQTNDFLLAQHTELINNMEYAKNEYRKLIFIKNEESLRYEKKLSDAKKNNKELQKKLERQMLDMRLLYNTALVRSGKKLSEQQVAVNLSFKDIFNDLKKLD
jgi:hypothetical protein